MKRAFGYALLFIAVFALVVFVLNTNLLTPESEAKPLVIAHRGLGQTFHREGPTGETCTADQPGGPHRPGPPCGDDRRSPGRG